MVKSKILNDSFEQIVELGQSTAKQGTKQIAQTFSPLKLIDQLAGKSSEATISPDEQNQTNEGKKNDAAKKGNTPLNLDRLQKKYQDQEKIKMESLRHRLFQMVKREDEKSLERKKLAEQQKKQQEEAKQEQKKRQHQQKIQEQQATGEPKGKIRRSIFSPKKVAQRSQAEIRPATGKQ